MLLLCLYAFSCSLNTSVPQGFFVHLCSADVMHSPFMSSMHAELQQDPRTWSPALNYCLLGALPLFIFSYYTCILGYCTYTVSSTDLKLNLFIYFCSFAFVFVLFRCHLSWHPIWKHEFFQILSYIIPISTYSSGPTDYISHYLLKTFPTLHLITTVLFQAFPSLQLGYFGFSLGFPCLWFPLITASPLKFCSLSSKLFTQ